MWHGRSMKNRLENKTNHAFWVSNKTPNPMTSLTNDDEWVIRWIRRHDWWLRGGGLYWMSFQAFWLAVGDARPFNTRTFIIFHHLSAIIESLESCTRGIKEFNYCQNLKIKRFFIPDFFSNLRKIKMTSKVNIVNPTRKRRFAIGSISESHQPRKIGKNVKGLKIMIRSGSIKTPAPMKPCHKCPPIPVSAPANQFEFNFQRTTDPEKNNEFIQQSSNFSNFVQKFPIVRTDDSKVTNGLCTLFSSILWVQILNGPSLPSFELEATFNSLTEKMTLMTYSHL